MIPNLDAQAPLFGNDKTGEVQVTREDLASLFNISETRINQLVKQGMPKKSHGKYDLVACVRWYIDMWRNKTSGTGAREINDERRDLLIAQTERTNLENARLRAELIETDKVGAVLNELAVIVSTQLDGLAARAANDVAPLDDVGEIQGVLFNECRLIRASIAARLETFAADFDNGDDRQATPAEDLRPMGRRKPRAAAGVT